MAVIKRQPGDSVKDLIDSIKSFAQLLVDQKETEAVAELERIAAGLASAQIESEDFKKLIKDTLDSFENEHELSAYLLNKPSDEWNEASQLSQAGSRMKNLAKRFDK